MRFVSKRTKTKEVKCDEWIPAY